MLDYEEFQNEKKDFNNQQTESKEKLGGKKKKKLHVKLKHFNKQKQEYQKNTSKFSDGGGSSYYDRYNGNKFI